MKRDDRRHVELKRWVDPRLVRLGDDLSDVTRAGDFSGLTEGAPGPGLLIYSS